MKNDPAEADKSGLTDRSLSTTLTVSVPSRNDTPFFARPRSAIAAPPPGPALRPRVPRCPPRRSTPSARRGAGARLAAAARPRRVHLSTERHTRPEITPPWRPAGPRRALRAARRTAAPCGAGRVPACRATSCCDAPARSAPPPPAVRSPVRRRLLRSRACVPEEKCTYHLQMKTRLRVSPERRPQAWDAARLRTAYRALLCNRGR